MDAQTVEGAIKARKLAERRVEEIRHNLVWLYDQKGLAESQVADYQDKILAGEQELLQLQSWLHIAEEG